MALAWIILASLACGEPSAETRARAQACRELHAQATTCVEWMTLEQMQKRAKSNMFRPGRDETVVQGEYTEGVRKCKKKAISDWNKNQLDELDDCDGLLSRLSMGLSF